MTTEGSNNNFRSTGSRRDFKPTDAHDNIFNLPTHKKINFTKFNSNINSKNFYSKKFYLSVLIILILVVFLVTLWPKSSSSNNNTANNTATQTQQQIILPDISSTEGKSSSSSTTNVSNTVSNTISNTGTQIIETNLITKTTPNNILTDNIVTYTRIVKKNDNISSIFKDLNISVASTTEILQDKKHKETFTQLKPGQKIIMSYNKITHDFLSMDYYLDKLRYLTIEKIDNYFVSTTKNIDLSEKTSYAKLKINSSLFEDAQKQHLPLDLIYQIIDIFTWDIDFAQDLRKNDTVEMLYKEYYLDGKYYTTGKILAVNFNNNGKTYGAIRYEDHENQSGYYTPEGMSLRKAFIRTPVKFTRISSTFSLERHHPVLHKIRAHKGVDYAAPTGTPIKAVGNGKVIFYGRKGGYGKTAIIQHGRTYSTLYAHMSNYNSKLKNGSPVKQGDIIGYVGQTGLATGPHLHFEFRINDQHVNPLTVALPRAIPILEKNKAKFMKLSKQLLAELKLQNTLNPAFSNQPQLAANNKFE
ncbi:MAG: peptidoglycan DD-metalloendopeptidase family protein [Gammaproteobacteria bacterium]|nr:peptidoglycan DD-metalloendopeptidase family protein [Gammaproteobacteria bacterium]